VVEGCTSRDHSGLGLYPGSGSQRPPKRGKTLSGNAIGIFFCWGVKNGLAEENDCTGNGVGISIGHRDTDNLVRSNRISESTTTGLLFRPEWGASFCGHRNRIEENRFADNGGEAAAVIDVQGGTEEVAIVGNTISEWAGFESLDCWWQNATVSI
jgi:parallel beta-helix repeat protein